MIFTAADIMSISSGTVKTWNGDDPTPAFLDSVFNTKNWRCAAANMIREFCEGMFDTLGNDPSFNEPSAWLTGNLYDDNCWFDYDENQAQFAAAINGYDVIGFRFQDHTMVFFRGGEHTYMVQWYKQRGCTEWILKMEGDEMATAQPVTAQEYADLLNDMLNETVAPYKATDIIEYNFWWMEELDRGEA